MISIAFEKYTLPNGLQVILHEDHSLPMAAVNAFGISGANAHLVVEGYDAVADPPHASRQWQPDGSPRLVAAEDTPDGVALASQAKRLLPLSAKTPEALKDLAGQYLSWLDEHADELSVSGEATDPLLSDMAWTASTGRSHFSQRAAVLFQDVDSLRRQLRVLAEAGREGDAEAVDSPNAATAGSAFESQMLEDFAAEYEMGRSVSFENLFRGEERRRISLPGYPFQRERHWVEGPK